MANPLTPLAVTQSLRLFESPTKVGPLAVTQSLRLFESPTKVGPLAVTQSLVFLIVGVNYDDGRIPRRLLEAKDFWTDTWRPSHLFRAYLLMHRFKT